MGTRYSGGTKLCATKPSSQFDDQRLSMTCTSPPCPPYGRTGRRNVESESSDSHFGSGALTGPLRWNISAVGSRLRRPVADRIKFFSARTPRLEAQTEQWEITDTVGSLVVWLHSRIYPPLGGPRVQPSLTCFQVAKILILFLVGVNKFGSQH
jgi:hypothetical protein